MSRMLLATLLLFLFASLCGCGGDSTSADPHVAGLSPAPAFLCDAQPGQSATVDDPEYGGEVTVRYEEAFTLFDGSQCRRGLVIIPRTAAEMVVICAQSDGYWHLAPRMWGLGGAAPATPVAPPVPLMNDEILPADR